MKRDETGLGGGSDTGEFGLRDDGEDALAGWGKDEKRRKERKYSGGTWISIEISSL